MGRRRIAVAIAIGIAVVGAATGGTLGWRRHVRAVRMRDAPACAQAVALGAVCGRCVAAFCCAEISACYGRSDCIDLNDCTIECGEEEVKAAGGAKGPACRPRCESKYATATVVFKAWDDCARSHCESECPRGEDD
jgi:hypothetical protein